MKKISAILLATMLLSFTAVASAEVKVKVIVDDEVIKEQSFIENSRTLAPLNATMTSAGAEVVWYGDTRTIDVKKDGKTITLKIDSNVMKTPDGDKTLDVAPKIFENNRTYLPIKAVCDEFGMDVLWDGGTKTVLVRSGDACPYVDRYNGITVEEYALENNLSNEEFAATLLLDYNDIKGKTVQEAESMILISEVLKNSGMETIPENYIRFGVLITEDMTLGEFEDELTLRNYFEYVGAMLSFPDAESALKSFRQYYSLGEEYTLDTKYKFVRTITDTQDFSK